MIDIYLQTLMGPRRPSRPAPGRWIAGSPGRVLAACALLALGIGPAEAESFAGRDPAAAIAEPAPLAPTILDSVTIGLPPILPVQPDVKDPVFAILVGLVSHGYYGTLGQAELRETIDRNRTRSRLPYRTVQEVTRLPVLPGQTARVTIRFDEPLDLPIPYSILGYNPGSFRTSQECTFREWILGTVRLFHREGDGKDATMRPVELQDVHLFGLEEGDVEIDIDGLVDRLLGGGIDDTDVTALMLCRHEGEWLGFAMGYNRDRRGRSGAFGFKKDGILFPTPGALKTVGRTMRGRAEALSARWRELAPGLQGIRLDSSSPATAAPGARPADAPVDTLARMVEDSSAAGGAGAPGGPAKESGGQAAPSTR